MAYWVKALSRSIGGPQGSRTHARPGMVPHVSYHSPGRQDGRQRLENAWNLAKLALTAANNNESQSAEK